MRRHQLRKLADELERLRAPNRRWDSDITRLLSAPPHAVLDHEAGIDGWDIVTRCCPRGEATVWLAADEVLYVTSSVDAAIELSAQVRPDDAAACMCRAFGALGALGPRGQSAEALAAATACQIMVEVLRAEAVTGRQPIKSVTESESALANTGS